MAIIVKETEPKQVAAKRNITLKNILVNEIRLVDSEGENLTDLFKDALPDGTDMVTLKVSFELSDED